MRIVVSGNCQVSGIAEALRTLRGDWTITSLPIGLPETIWAEHGRNAINTCDAWVRMRTPRDHVLGQPPSPAVIVEIPPLAFSGFHPDIVFAALGDSQFLGLTAYHSAIALWAWRAGLSVEQTMPLYSSEILIELGYLNAWRDSVAEMEATFSALGLDFRPVWQRLMQLGVFMHTVNHPRIEALSLLAKLVAIRLGAEDSIWDDPVERYVRDELDTAVWPVYPAIADVLGVPQSVRWRLLDTTYRDLFTYLEAAWNAYGDTDRRMVTCAQLDGTNSIYSSVLSRATGASVA